MNIFGSTEHPTEVRTEQGLGWSLSGEKGKVRVIAELPRPDWVAGQNVWIKIFADNQSQKKVSLAFTRICKRLSDELPIDTNSEHCAAGTSGPLQAILIEARSGSEPVRSLAVLRNPHQKEDLRRDDRI